MVLLVAVASPGTVVTLAIVVPVPAMVLAVMLEVVVPLVLLLLPLLLLLLLLLLPLRLLATRRWPAATRSNPHPALEHVGSEPVAPVEDAALG